MGADPCFDPQILSLGGPMTPRISRFYTRLGGAKYIFFRCFFVKMCDIRQYTLKIFFARFARDTTPQKRAPTALKTTISGEIGAKRQNVLGLAPSRNLVWRGPTPPRWPTPIENTA